MKEEIKEWKCECGMTLPRWATTMTDGNLRCQECKLTWTKDGKRIFHNSMKNSTQKLLEDKMEEFDKKFPTFNGIGASSPIFRSNENPNHIKNFIKQTSLALATSLLKESLPERKPEQNLDFFEDGVRVGFNRAIHETEQNFNRKIEEVKNY